MRARCAIAAASAVMCAGSAFAGGEPLSSRAPQCFDVAVIAKLESENYTTLEFDDPSVILMDVLFHWKFKIERPLAGTENRASIDVSGLSHTGFNRRIRHYLLFLQRKPDDSYELASTQYQLVRDDHGDFVIPLTEPMSPESLKPEHLFPANYEQLLRPIQYRVEDAWWLSAKYLDPDGDSPIQAANYPWGRIEKSGVVADRSLPVTDLVSALADRRCPAK
jgi:hypothetical protein